MNLFTLFGKSRTASVGSMPPTKPSGDILPLPIKYNGNAPKEWADKIEYAFTSGSVHFFRFISEPYIPYTRANAALDIYEELEWGISPAFLQKHIQAVDSVLTDPKNKTKEQLLAKLAVLNSHLKERFGLATNLTLRMKLATVLYFDETEDITTYNYQYGVAKAKHWAESHDIPDFFFEAANSKLSALFARLGAEFGNAYTSRGNKGNPPSGSSYYAEYTRRNKSRIAELIRLTKGVIRDYQELEVMAIWKHNVVKEELIQMLKGKK